MRRYIYLNIALLLLFVSLSSVVSAAESRKGTSIKALIPARVDIRIFGYTAPNAIVQATGVRVFAQVSSDVKGYFLIDPLSVSQEAKEVCLTTIDNQGRAGFPLCISLPEQDKPTEIGPLLLSPTLSLSSGSIWQDQTAAASGQTIPNTVVDISFFEANNTMKAKISTSLVQKIVHPAQAMGLPLLTTKSDRKGNFSVSLPTWKASFFRIFAKSYYNKAPTHKSLTISFTIGRFIEYWKKHTLPILLQCLILLNIFIAYICIEYKTKKGRLLFAKFNETRLKPFVVKTHLQLVRLRYNLQDYLRSNRK